MPSNERLGLHHCEEVAPGSYLCQGDQSNASRIVGPTRLHLSLHV
jgi:hypothetical protein